MQAPDFKAESDSDDEDETNAGRRAPATITRPVDPGDVHVSSSLEDVTGPEFKDQVRNVDPSGRRERRLRVGNGGKIGQGEVELIRT